MDSQLTRRRFLETSAALLGVSIVGCGSQGTSTPGTSANADGSFTLTGIGELAAGSAVPFNFPNGEPGLIFVSKDGKEGAVSAKCTHSGCTVEWNEPANAQVPLRCPCHESLFSIDGQVLSGPAKSPLARYSVSRSDGGIMLKKI